MTIAPEDGLFLSSSSDSLMKLSVIIPAYNEAKRIESCLHHLAASLRATASPELESEIIVVDNNSTDATAELAHEMGARVVFEPVNQIARARNAGAAVASGDWLLFVDADTLVTTATLAEMLASVEAGGHVGGASILRFDKPPRQGFGGPVQPDHPWPEIDVRLLHLLPGRCVPGPRWL